jgi:small subunit ribosomal protein S9
VSVDNYTNEIIATGRRKESTARVRIKPGSGQMIVNGKSVKEYLMRDVLVMVAKQPFEATETQNKFDVRIRCNGGGLTGQAGAIRLGIARALIQHNAEMRGTLKKAGLLTRDAREVERKKYGQPGARKNFQFSKR